MWSVTMPRKLESPSTWSLSYGLQNFWIILHEPPASTPRMTGLCIHMHWFPNKLLSSLLVELAHSKSTWITVIHNITNNMNMLVHNTPVWKPHPTHHIFVNLTCIFLKLMCTKWLCIRNFLKAHNSLSFQYRHQGFHNLHSKLLLFSAKCVKLHLQCIEFPLGNIWNPWHNCLIVFYINHAPNTWSCLPDTSARTYINFTELAMVICCPSSVLSADATSL